MIKSLLYVISLILICCSSPEKAEEQKVIATSPKAFPPNDTLITKPNFDSTGFVTNDSVCVFNKFESEHIKLQIFCHVFFNDSITRVLGRKLSVEELDSAWNFEVGQNIPVKYHIKNNLIIVKKLFFHIQRNSRYELDKIIMTKNAINIKLKESVRKENGQMRYPMSEMVYMKILLKKNTSKNLKIYIRNY